MTTGNEPANPFILSLGIDADSQERLDRLRRRYFPPERNFLQAHITLFHALPGDASSEASIRATLSEICQRYAPFFVTFPALRSLGRGVAVTIDAPELLRLRTELAREFADWLTPQDQQRFQPHVTIQNKVTPDAAKELFAQLSPSWEPFIARAEAVLLWRYKNGPWEPIERFVWRGAGEEGEKPAIKAG